MTLIPIIARFFSSLKRKPLFYQYDHHKKVDRLTAEIIDESNETNQRTGMRLFCRLPGEAANKIVGQEMDPYYISMSRRELWEWINVHIFFDNDGEIAAVHDYGHLMWRRPDFELERK
jgi:hypothetical protein